MLKKKRSRRMPALFTTTSMRPKASRAACTMRFAEVQSATLSVLAAAVPPVARISSATFCAGPLLAPSPLTEVPRSLTSTFAPAAAMASAKSRPMPPPAPVTRTTLPSSMDLLSRAMLASALNPKSVAIIGASDNPHKVGGRPLLFLKRYGFRGAIYPINPGRTTVQDLRAYPSIDATPEAPDLAIVAIAGEDAVGAVAACAARGVKVAVVMTSGFGETGEQGLARQKEMAEAARAAGMRL